MSIDFAISVKYSFLSLNRSGTSCAIDVATQRRVTRRKRLEIVFPACWSDAFRRRNGPSFPVAVRRRFTDSSEVQVEIFPSPCRRHGIGTRHLHHSTGGNVRFQYASPYVDDGTHAGWESLVCRSCVLSVFLPSTTPAAVAYLCRHSYRVPKSTASPAPPPDIRAYTPPLIIIYRIITRPLTETFIRHPPPPPPVRCRRVWSSDGPPTTPHHRSIAERRLILVGLNALICLAEHCTHNVGRPSWENRNAHLERNRTKFVWHALASLVLVVHGSYGLLLSDPRNNSRHGATSYTPFN